MQHLDRDENMKKTIIWLMMFLFLGIFVYADIEENLINSLVTYVRFEENFTDANNSVRFVDSSSYKYPFFNATSLIPENRTGKIGSSRYFNGTTLGMRFWLEAEHPHGSDNFTDCMWIKLENKTGWRSFWGTWKGLNDDRYYSVRQDGLTLSGYFADEGIKEVSTGTTNIGSNWTFV